MKVLLTGATGFIGSYIMKDFRKAGHEVVGYDNVVDNTSIQMILPAEELAGIPLIQGDIRDLAGLIRVCQDYQIDTIVHQAGLLGAADRNYLEAAGVNIIGTLNVLETARILKLRRVVWASSQTIFGPQNLHREEWIPNDGMPHPWDNYSSIKTYLEFVGREYARKFGVDNLALRYCIVYGMGRMERHGAYPSQLMVNPAMGVRGVVDYGDDAPNWLYVEDAARATLLACTVPHTRSRAFTITGEILSMKELRDYILTLLPEAEIELKPGRYGCGWRFDGSAAREELGYEPKVSAREGARKTINEVRRQMGLPLV